jgi:hypothetical protein
MSETAAIETAECQACGAEEEPEDMKDGLCNICQRYLQGSYEWHLACYCDNAEPSIGDEVDAFRSGWLRALSEVNERLIDGADIDQVIKDLEKEAGS